MVMGKPWAITARDNRMYRRYVSANEEFDRGFEMLMSLHWSDDKLRGMALGMRVEVR